MLRMPGNDDSERPNLNEQLIGRIIAAFMRFPQGDSRCGRIGGSIRNR